MLAACSVSPFQRYENSCIDQLAAPASEPALGRLAEQLRLILPEEMRALYRVYDGGFARVLPEGGMASLVGRDRFSVARLRVNRPPAALAYPEDTCAVGCRSIPCHGFLQFWAGCEHKAALARSCSAPCLATLNGLPRLFPERLHKRCRFASCCR